MLESVVAAQAPRNESTLDSEGVNPRAVRAVADLQASAGGDAFRIQLRVRSTEEAHNGNTETIGVKGGVA